jgi:ribonuclease P protein component
VPGGRPLGRFTARQRIRKRREYERVQESGRRATTPHFVFLQFAREEAGEARLGVVASRKVGTAVVRNRCKRLVREAFRQTSDLWAPGIDIVVIVRRTLNRMKLDEVVDEWRSAVSALKRRAAEASSDGERRIVSGAAHQKERP